MNDNEISLIHLMLDASLVVQLVMIILLSLAFIAWLIIVKKTRFLWEVKQSVTEFEEQFTQSASLADVYKYAKNSRSIGVQQVFEAAFEQFVRARNQDGASPKEVLERTHRGMRVALLKSQERLQSHIPLLATIGSASPYIGLFGTVWGIMDAFLSLSGASQATLQSVAPGIAEALIATAMGLFAAIPAVIAYNRFVAHTDNIIHKTHTFAEELYSLFEQEAYR